MKIHTATSPSISTTVLSKNLSYFVFLSVRYITASTPRIGHTNQAMHCKAKLAKRRNNMNLGDLGLGLSLGVAVSVQAMLALLQGKS